MKNWKKVLLRKILTAGRFSTFLDSGQNSCFLFRFEKIWFKLWSNDWPPCDDHPTYSLSILGEVLTEIEDVW